MTISLPNRPGTSIKFGKISKTQESEKTAKSAMTDGFVRQIKAHAREDAKQGDYMSEDFSKMRLTQMKRYVSPVRSGPKAEVMSEIQAALKEPHPMLQALEKMLDELSGGCSGKLQICSIQQTAEITAPNGEVIASYNSLGGGWTDIQTREEHKFYSETASVYLQAFREARAEMRAAAPAPEAGSSLSGMDIRV